MQYPIEELSQLMRSELLHPKHFSTLNEEATCSLSNLLSAKASEAKLLICTYIGTAQNEQQACYMLHALHIAIKHLTNQAIQRKEQLKENNTAVPDNVISIYGHAENELNLIEEFLSVEFGNIKVIAPAGTSSPVKKMTEAYQLNTNLSVPQIGLLIRLLVDSGIVNEQSNISSLINKVSNVVSARKTKHISAESLRIKYYLPEKAAINIVKEYLSEMMQLLRKY